MDNIWLAQAQNKTQTLSANKVISGSFMVAGALMLNKATNDRHKELNRELPFLEAVNEELKKFAKDTQMKMMREQMFKEVKENVNKHSKSLMGFMTGFGLLASGATIALLNRNNHNAQEDFTPSSEFVNSQRIKDSIKGVIEVGSLGYALGFALGVAGSGAYNIASGNTMNSDTILGTLKNGHISGLGSAAMGVYIGSQKGLHKGSASLHGHKNDNSLLEQDTIPKKTPFIEKVRRGKRQRDEQIER